MRLEKKVAPGTPHNKGERKTTKLFTTRMPLDLIAQAEGHAKAAGMPCRTFMKHILIEGLNALGPPPTSPKYTSAPQVYFVEVEPDIIKIGMTTDLQGRLKTLQIAHARPLRLLLCIPGDMKCEKKLHQRFKDAHIKRELFRATPSLLTYIEAECASRMLSQKALDAFLV